VPFLLAFILDKLAQRAARRQRQAIQYAYAGPRTIAATPAGTATLFCAYPQGTPTRRAELAALLHALHLYGEPCWWCGAPAAEPMMATGAARRAPAV
jgi:hypothetical protein